MKYIPAEKLITIIEERKSQLDQRIERYHDFINQGISQELAEILSLITSLQQEQPEVDLEKLGEIARHIIAVKQNVEDMRLNEDEWSLLERIGYPQKLNARKEEK